MTVRIPPKQIDMFRFVIVSLATMSFPCASSAASSNRISDATLTAFDLNGISRTLPIAGKPNKNITQLIAADGYSFAELSVSKPSVRSGVNNAPFLGRGIQSTTRLTYFVEFFDNSGSDAITYDVSGVFRQSYKAFLNPGAGLLYAGNSVLDAASSVTISVYNGSSFPTGYSFSTLTQFDLNAFTSAPIYNSSSRYSLSSGNSLSLLEDIQLDTKSYQGGIMRSDGLNIRTSSAIITHNVDDSFDQAFSAKANVPINKAGFGTIRVDMVSSSAKFQSGSMSGLHSSEAYGDPFFTIDPNYLRLHPGAKLNVLDGYGNSGLGGVPEPATWALMISGFGMAGAMIRRRRLAQA